MEGSGTYRHSTVLALILAWLVVTAGCQSTKHASLGNPFGVPDRVPPPGTRALTPGAAQPYYPGEPVPVLQGAAPVEQPTFAGGEPAPVAAPAAATTASLAAPPAAAAQVPSQQVSLAPAAGFSSVANQPTLAPTSPPGGSFASSHVADTGFTNPASPAAADPRIGQLAANSAAEASGNPGNSAPWRSPGVSPIVASNVGQASYGQGVSPAAYAPQGAFGSAPQSAAPRIRFPTGGAGVQQAGFTTPVAAVPQTVGITELPGQPVVANPAGGNRASGASPWQAAPSNGFQSRNPLR